MSNITRDVKSIYLEWKVHYKKVKAMIYCIQKPEIYTPELLPEVDLVQRVLTKPKPKPKNQYDVRIK